MSNARLLTLSGLLAFIGGFIDVVCFFGLKGLLAAHITGNLATLCASIVLGTAGLISKIVAVPEFMIVVAFAHMTARILKRYGWPAVRILLGFEAVLLTAFLALAVRYGPFADPDSDVALVTALAAIAAMAVQNAVQRAQLTRIPPTSFMTATSRRLLYAATWIVLATSRSAAIAITAAAARAMFWIAVRMLKILSSSRLWSTISSTPSVLLYWS